MSPKFYYLLTLIVRGEDIKRNSNVHNNLYVMIKKNVQGEIPLFE